MAGRDVSNLYRQSLILALLLALAGEVFLWILYGLIWFPGQPWIALLWSSTCGLAMGATMGVFVCLFVVGMEKGRRAFLAALTVSAGVLSVCNLVCFAVDQKFNVWGAVDEPATFLLGGFVGVVFGSLVYSYLLFTENGFKWLSWLRL